MKFGRSMPPPPLLVDYLTR